jgi:stearoyl-CoA desaturase (delta-9 desaturase)
MTAIIFTLVVTHITIACVTLFLHRSQAHKSVAFHPAVSHFMRFWLWLTTGMVTKEWVAVHRKHHAFSDTIGDPHSPRVFGLGTVLFGGAFLYAKAARDQKMLKQYGVGTPNDWIEQNVYSRYPWLGIVLMFTIDAALFQNWGIVVWLVQMAWIPFWAAGVINGVAHCFGYRNGKTRDRSKNLVPWGIVIGGEELHNNHHLNPASAKLSLKEFEFDIGWFYIQILRRLNLATVK